MAGSQPNGFLQKPKNYRVGLASTAPFQLTFPRSQLVPGPQEGPCLGEVTGHVCSVHQRVHEDEQVQFKDDHYSQAQRPVVHHLYAL